MPHNKASQSTQHNKEFSRYFFVPFTFFFSPGRGGYLNYHCLHLQEHGSAWAQLSFDCTVRAPRLRHYVSQREGQPPSLPPLQTKQTTQNSIKIGVRATDQRETGSQLQLGSGSRTVRETTER